jgi:hypothetical protein
VSAATEARFVVEQVGASWFSAHDTITQLDYDLSFTREAAQRAADRRNAALKAEEPK